MKRLMVCAAVVLMLVFTGTGFRVPSATAISGDYDIVGDSIAVGYASSGPGYIGYLAYYIKNAAPAIVLTGNYINSFGLYTDAIGGSTSVTIMNRLSSILDADNYILLVGTNDMASFVPLDIYAQNMHAIISDLLQRRPNTRVYVCTILPRSDNFNYNVAITAFNQRLSQIVQGFASPRVKLIDTCTLYFSYYYFYYSVYGQYWADFYFLADGLHPTPYGYGILANYIVGQLD